MFVCLWLIRWSLGAAFAKIKVQPGTFQQMFSCGAVIGMVQTRMMKISNCIIDFVITVSSQIAADPLWPVCPKIDSLPTIWQGEKNWLYQVPVRLNTDYVKAWSPFVRPDAKHGFLKTRIEVTISIAKRVLFSCPAVRWKPDSPLVVINWQYCWGKRLDQVISITVKGNWSLFPFVWKVHYIA